MRLLITLSLFCFALDQVTKWWIVYNLPYPTYLPHNNPESAIAWIPDFLYIVHVGNTGAAWGMFSGYGFVLGIIGIVAIALIFIFRKSLELHKTYLQICFGLMVGGIAGNVVDRFFHGHVIDFIDVWLPGYRWPAFNVADSCICVGVILYVLHNLSTGFREETSEPSDNGPQNA